MYYNTLYDKYKQPFQDPWDWSSMSVSQIRHELARCESVLQDHSYLTACKGHGLVDSATWQDFVASQPHGSHWHIVRDVCEFYGTAEQLDPEFRYAASQLLDGAATGLVTGWVQLDANTFQVEVTVWSKNEEHMLRRELPIGRSVLRDMQASKSAALRKDLLDASRRRGDSQSRLTDSTGFETSKPHPADDPDRWASEVATRWAGRPHEVPESLEGVLKGALSMAAHDMKDMGYKRVYKPRAKQAPMEPSQRKLEFGSQGLSISGPPIRAKPRDTQREQAARPIFSARTEPDADIPKQRVRDTIRMALEASAKVEIQKQLQDQRKAAMAWDKEHKARSKAARKDAQYSAAVVAEDIGIMRHEDMPERPQGKYSERQGRRPQTDRTKAPKIDSAQVEKAIMDMGGYRAVWNRLRGLQESGRIWLSQGIDVVDNDKKYETPTRRRRK